MTTTLVVGAGPIGTAITHQLVEAGHQVRLASRSGRGPDRMGVQRVAIDANDHARLTELATGVGTIVNAVNLPYHRWSQDWPPLHRSFQVAAETSGADLLLIGCYYGYPAGVPMSPETPLDPPTRKGAIRAQMWQDLLSAHESGRFRTLELRASDYVGPESLDTPNAHGGARLVTPILSGKPARVVGNPDAPHSWTAVTDIARAAATLIGEDHAWGRAWHVPTAAPRSIRQLARDITEAGGAPEPRIGSYPRWMLRTLGVAMPQMRELVEMLYQFEEPFISDDGEMTERFGLQPTSWEETIEATVAAARSEGRAIVVA